jgi:hypothetical protein
VAVLRYDDKVLRRLPENSGRWVRGLCERSHPYYAAFADTLERWFAELGGNKRMLRDLTSPDDVEFYAGRWELTAARLFHNAGYQIEFEPRVHSTLPGSTPKTPDFRATGDGIRPLVEVFNLNPSAAEAEEDRRHAQLGADLNSRLDLGGRGMLSLRLYPHASLKPYPEAAAVDEAASAIQQWWDAGHDTGLHLDADKLPIYGHWMDTPDSPLVVVSPPARVLTADRIRSRLEGKLGRYKNLTGEQIILFVGSDYWTHSTSTMIDALFGSTQIPLVGETEDGMPSAGQPTFSGEGLLTEDPVSGHPGSKLVAGCMFASHQMFNPKTGSWNLYLHYVHNPFADVRLDDGTFDPIPEFQPRPDGMVWTTEDSVVVTMP